MTYAALAPLSPAMRVSHKVATNITYRQRVENLEGRWHAVWRKPSNPEGTLAELDELA